MLRETALIWWHLGILTRKRYDLLTAQFGDMDTATQHLSEEFIRGLKIREEGLRDALERLASLDLENLEARLAKSGILLASCEDDAYPQMLRELPDAPLFLSWRGDIEVLRQPLLALVGTRNMTHYGKQVALRFVEPIVRAGMVTVSGLASGIDTVIAQQTLKANGKTVAVLGHGLHMIFPADNRTLADDIVEGGGLLVSEFPLDIQPSNYTFPARNRIIAGLSLGTVVLEAPTGSGAIITADLALDYNRAVFAVPGPIFDANYEGCHMLIAKGHARLVSTPEEVLTELGFVVSTESVAANYETQNPQEEAIYRMLTSMPKHTDEIVQETGLSVAEVGTALTMMEIAGAAKNAGGNKWIRC